MQSTKTSTGNTVKIFTSEGMFFFETENIIRLEASRSYTNIFFTNNKKILASKVLKEFADMLEPLGFLRTHRTHLVNCQHIVHVAPNGNIIMRDASVAEISRRKKGSVMKMLKAA